MSNEAPHHLDVGATLDRIEQGVSPLPVEMSLASIAISMRQIATELSAIHQQMIFTHSVLSSINGNTSHLSRLPNYR